MVCNFVEKYVHGHIPENMKQMPDVKDLVMKLQTHAHSSYCRLHINTKCRFNFPKPPSTRTIVSRQLRVDERNETDAEENSRIMQAIHERLDLDASLGIEEILQKEGILEERYIECLQSSSNHRSCIILK